MKDWLKPSKPQPIDDLLSDPALHEVFLGAEVPAVHKDAEVRRAEVEHDGRDADERLVPMLRLKLTAVPTPAG